MKVVIAIDSFKGSLSSLQAGNAVKDAVLRLHANAEIVITPLADGGEGTVAAMAESTDAEMIACTVTGPLLKPVTASYCILKNSQTAVIEMAAAAGITLISADERNPMETTTYGVGELIKDAIAKGCRRFIVGIGGSATNDGGTGALSALGYKFLNEKGEVLKGTGEELAQIVTIDATSAIDFSGIELTLLCDVSNPLLGADGATHTYGRQKGATDADLDFLEAGMQNFAKVAQEYCGKSLNVAGGGAAGGLGAALYAFLNAKICSGIETVLDLCDFNGALQNADFVITGEGRVDWQSANGKVIDGILKRANAYTVPVVAIAGSIGTGAEKLYQKGLAAAFSIMDKPMTLEEAIQNAETLYAQTAENVFRLIKASR